MGTFHNILVVIENNVPLKDQIAVQRALSLSESQEKVKITLLSVQDYPTNLFARYQQMFDH